MKALTEMKMLEGQQTSEKPFDWDALSMLRAGAVYLVMLSLISCQLAMHESHASATKWEKDTNITWGGTTHTTGADGWDNATDHNASFQVAMQTGGVALAGWIGYLTQKSNNLLSQMQNANLTKQQIAGLKFQYLTTQAQLQEATKQDAINAGLAPAGLQ